MRKIILLASILFVAAAVGTAQMTFNDPNAVKRAVGGFHAVEVSGGVDLYIAAGTEAVAVSASSEKYRDKIKTEVKEGVLHIWYETGLGINLEWGDKKLKAYVSFSTLDGLRAGGGSDIIADGSLNCPRLRLGLSGGSDFKGQVETEELKVEASGGSDVNISGHARRLKIGTSGGSDFHGYQLSADDCELVASGGSDVRITVNRQLDARASGGSDVYFKGNAAISNSESSGSSSIQRVRS